MFTILIMAFHSRHLLPDLVKSIGMDFPIVILDNSQDYDLKSKLEKDYSNVTVIIPKENLGFAKGANLAISQIKSEYIFINPSDVFLPKKCFLAFQHLKPSQTDGCSNCWRSRSYGNIPKPHCAWAWPLY